MTLLFNSRRRSKILPLGGGSLAPAPNAAPLPLPFPEFASQSCCCSLALSNDPGFCVLRVHWVSIKGCIRYIRKH